MNIFKALSQGDGSINETNVTSFFSFICNESNEFSASFLILFLEEINKKLDKDLIEIQGNSYRQKVECFKSRYTFSAQPEYRLQFGREIQDLDILFTISDKKGEADLYYLLIENKIKKSSYIKDQCKLQYDLFKKIEDFQEETPVISVLISPDDEKFQGMINSVKTENDLSVWFKWETDKENSIVEIFKSLIQLENSGEISPIDNNAKYILKSFIDYISNELSATNRKGSYNKSIAGAEVVDQCEFKRNGKIYFLKRYDNKMIRIFDSENNLQNEPVKPILREIIQNYSLAVSLERSPGKPKNTQILGRDVIIEMKNDHNNGS